uniref:Uncharacterized protein n=1 Tax=Marmota marmota marmota TaxID=9994 RepID=A0A8C5ZEI4_MARMA
MFYFHLLYLALREAKLDATQTAFQDLFSSQILTSEQETRIRPKPLPLTLLKSVDTQKDTL